APGIPITRTRAIASDPCLVMGVPRSWMIEEETMDDAPKGLAPSPGVAVPILPLELKRQAGSHRPPIPLELRNADHRLRIVAPGPPPSQGVVAPPGRPLADEPIGPDPGVGRGTAKDPFPSTRTGSRGAHRTAPPRRALAITRCRGADPLSTIV